MVFHDGPAEFGAILGLGYRHAICIKYTYDASLNMTNFHLSVDDT